MKRYRFPYWLIFTLVITIGAIIVGGLWFYKVRRNQRRLSAENQLIMIANLHVNGIVNWRADLVADASVQMDNPFFREGFPKWISSGVETDKADILSTLKSLCTHYGYINAMLIDASGKILCSLNPPEGALHGEVFEILEQTFTSNEPQITHLHKGPGEFPPHIGVIAPFYLSDQPNVPPVGALLLVTDARRFLFPLIQSWPSSLKTAETLLIRKDGNDVLFLNDLRFRDDAAMSFRIPLDRLDVPAVKAILGAEGTFIGMDYRGVEVLSILKAIPNSPWFLFTKQDTKEVFENVRHVSGLILALIALLIFCATGVAGLIWLSTGKAHYKRMLESELALQSSEQRHTATLLGIGDGVISTDINGNVEVMNHVAEELTGWRLSEAKGRPIDEVFVIVNEGSGEKVDNLITRVLREGVIVGLANHTELIARDGRRFSIADSAAPIPDDEGNITGVVLVFSDQTDERAARRALMESENRYRTFLNSNDDLTFLKDSKFQYLFINDANAPFIKRPVSDITGLTDFDIMPQQEVARGCRASDQRVLDENRLVVSEEHIGDRIYETRKFPVQLGDGTIAVGGYIRDVTNVRTANAVVMESERRFRQAFEQAAIGKILTAPDGKRLRVNHALCEMLGYDESELMNMDIADTTHPDDLEISNECFRSLLANERKTFNFEKRYLASDGRTIWTSVSATLLRDSKGNPINFITDIYDISSRKSAESRVGHLNRVLRAIRDINQLIVKEKSRDTLIHKAVDILIEHRSYDGALIILNDKDGSIESFAASGLGSAFEPLAASINSGKLPACCRLADSCDGVYLVTEREVNCANCPLEIPCSTADALAIALRHEGYSSGYLVVLTESGMGEDHEEQSLLKELAGDIAFSLYNIEQAKQKEKTETEKESLKSQLWQSQKMEAVGRLAGGVAHDFNNLLSVILGYSEMLLENTPSDHPNAKKLNDIHEAGMRAKSLTSQLLAFGRKQMLEMKVVEINELIRNFAKLLRPVISEDIVLELDFSGKEIHIRADVTQMEQVLMNLAINARDAMPQGGSLSITTSIIEYDDIAPDKMLDLKTGSYAIITVSDTGSGFDKETGDQIFEPFFSTKDKDKGTGLGLATVYGIVKQHGGGIWYYSEPGIGTTFKVYLPISKVKVQPVQAREDAKRVFAPKATVLVVEDEEPVRRLVCDILNDRGLNVLVAADAHSSVELAQNAGSPIDLLLTDVVMPGMKGTDVYREVSKAHPEIKVLYMSGYTENIVAIKGVIVEGVHFLQKPFTVRQFLEKVSEVLNTEV